MSAFPEFPRNTGRSTVCPACGGKMERSERAPSPLEAGVNALPFLKIGQEVPRVVMYVCNDCRRRESSLPLSEAGATVVAALQWSEQSDAVVRRVVEIKKAGLWEGQESLDIIIGEIVDETGIDPVDF